MVLNLVRNAAEAMVAVDDRPRTLTLATARDDDQMVTVTVRDLGVGLRGEAPGRLFDPFHTTKPLGMGIGLFLSRSIVEAYGGRIGAKPNDGSGATFWFSLPAASRATSSGPPARSPSAKRAAVEAPT